MTFTKCTKETNTLEWTCACDQCEKEEGKK